MIIEKRKPYRNRKLLDQAHDVKYCMFRSPVCKGYQAHGCEPIHSDFSEHGKGGGQKADDDQHAAGCHDCHEWFGKKLMPRQALFDMFNRARTATFNYYRNNGNLKKAKYIET